MRAPIRSLRRRQLARRWEPRLEAIVRRRATWDETWLNVARSMAERSQCVRDRVGAVIVDPMNRVVATSYNGTPVGWPDSGPCINFCQRAKVGPDELTMQSYTDCPSLHAEANSIAVCDRSMRAGGIIYVTSDICWNCAKLIANSGLVRVVVQRDRQHRYRDSQTSYELLEHCGIEVVHL